MGGVGELCSGARVFSSLLACKPLTCMIVGGFLTGFIGIDWIQTQWLVDNDRGGEGRRVQATSVVYEVC